jgi:hypothetical protein
MTALADTLPNDPGTLKAMLLAERARAERLEQILEELQRHKILPDMQAEIDCSVTEVETIVAAYVRRENRSRAVITRHSISTSRW